MNIETAKKLLRQNTEVYDKVFSDFARTREGKIRELLPFGECARDGDRVLDAGTGSGRLYGIFKDRNVEFFGIDASTQLVELTKKTWRDFPRAHFQVGDLLVIPFPDAYFNVVYCIATLHHIPSYELRKKALSELNRVLKPNGKLIMTNWYFWTFPAVYIILKYFLMKLFVPLFHYSHILENMRIVDDFDLGDIFVPWGKQGLRYYHSFRKNELKKLLLETGFPVKGGSVSHEKNINQFLERKAGDHWGKRVNLLTIASKL